MQLSDNVQSFYTIRNSSCGTKLFKLPMKKLNIQKRSINNNNYFLKSNNLNKYNLYSTKEATPRKDHNQVLTHSGIKKNFYPPKEKSEKCDLDDSLSNISHILNSNKKDLNYSGLLGKIPGINDEEPNFVYDQILYNKSRINKAKILSRKIGVLKLPISTISSKETLTNSDREKKCFSDRAQGSASSNENKKGKNNFEDSVDISCCFFGKK